MVGKLCWSASYFCVVYCFGCIVTVRDKVCLRCFHCPKITTMRVARIAASTFWRKIERFSNYQPTTNHIFSMETRGKIHCVVLCQQNHLCKSTYFNSDTGLCTGLNVDPDHPLGTKNSGIAHSFYRQVPPGCLQAEYEWVPSINLCFSFKLSLKLTMADAKTFCEREGAQIASLSTDEKFDFIREYDRKGFAGNFYALVLGGFLNATDDKWYWVNGDTLDMSRFCRNEPSGGASCLFLACEANPWCYGIKNRLDDVPCSVKGRFVCERTV